MSDTQREIAGDAGASSEDVTIASFGELSQEDQAAAARAIASLRASKSVEATTPTIEPSIAVAPASDRVPTSPDQQHLTEPVGTQSRNRLSGRRVIGAITLTGVAAALATAAYVTRGDGEASGVGSPTVAPGSLTPGPESTPTPSQTVELLSPETFSYFYNGSEYIGKEGFVNSMVTRGAIQPTPEEGERLIRSMMGHFNSWVSSGVNTVYEVDTISRPVLSGNGFEMIDEAYAGIISRDDALEDSDPLVKTVKTMRGANIGSWFDEEGNRRSPDAREKEFTFSGLDVVSVDNVFTDGMVVTGTVTVQSNSPDIIDKAPTTQVLDLRLAINANAEWEYMQSTKAPDDK